ncbi:MAG TPA: peptidoglycan editing factor PgeF [Anaerolineae bacterium]|nr:peptidoglycan editing factor PgeF [Anaerolineae bacterium]
MRQLRNHTLVYYQFDGLSQYSNVYHGIFTRLGGVSRAPFESLNLSRSVGDEAETVQENNRRMLAIFDATPARTVTAWLVHGAAVAVVDRNDAGSYRNHTDAIITNDPSITLTMRFADCAPIVFFDPVRHALGIAHAGWRGVAANIVQAMVHAMRTAFQSDPQNLWAGIGPCISVDRYRVGPEVIAAVRAACPPASPITRSQPDGSTHLDLNAAIDSQLRACGLTQIEVSGQCTATNTREWFSHRAENGKTGRFGVALGLHE